MSGNEAALREKQAGNEAYKNKDFATAHQHYDKAIELDPSDMTFLMNKAGQSRRVLCFMLTSLTLQRPTWKRASLRSASHSVRRQSRLVERTVLTTSKLPSESSFMSIL